ncbi:MAG: double-strand break repair helicase AddA [Alphaproteobacteria bacterium]
MIAYQSSQHIDEAQRSLDPNVRQRAASNPHESIWVGASAGTGKTKVLTDRVLRLLLPRFDGRPGTLPGRILCLTFTKAAANEMALRINKTLGRWAVMDLDHDNVKLSLRQTLSDLLGEEPNEMQLAAAQRLFADVIDCPGGLQIMTIHSFCQSILGRFPLEANLPPNFKGVDDTQANALMDRALNDAIILASRDDNADSPFSNAFFTLSSELDEQSFKALVRDICGERYQLHELLARYHTVEGVYAAICTHYDIEQGREVIDVVRSACEDGHIRIDNLRMVAQSMIDSGAKEAMRYGQGILSWVMASTEERIRGFDGYKGIFLTDKGMRSRSFPPAKVKKDMPNAFDILSAEAQRLMYLGDYINRIKSASMTRDALLIGTEVLKHYTDLKSAQGALDYDDLILYTMQLLRGESKSFTGLEAVDYDRVAPWIMYKLDRGLDHILVDEAQDTNPEQWRIIETLCNEFFEGLSARDDTERTMFTVGDIKQSIYSFQRAAPAEFRRMHGVLDEKIALSEHVHRTVDLDISFRSTQSVLRVVDKVFENSVLNKAVGGGVISHKSFRAGQAGRVELWPDSFQTKKAEQRDFWDPPVIVKDHMSGASALANYIAQQIKGWLDNEEVLPSYNRAIEAGDIMILVRTRTAFVDQLVRALKLKGVPVSGADRMVLGDQLVVQDLLALARFCLLPDDDLNLGCVLKSPFLGWNEEELFSLAYNRAGTLWQELCNFDSSKLSAVNKDGALPIVSKEKREEARDYLSRLAGRGKYMGAYEFFSHILHSECPVDTRSGLRAVRKRLGQDALDPVEEFMNAALNFGQDNIDHLQLFLQQQDHNKIEIKREMDEQGGQVRIMTIHGSKGLQAPIVIMPDTMITGAAKKGGRLLWSNKTGLDMPLYSLRKDDDPEEYRAAFTRGQSLDEEEYYRLLYVAMTRAADRLYIAGYSGMREGKDSSWYYVIRNAMQDDPNCVTLDDGTLRIENEQISPPDKAKNTAPEKSDDDIIPPWAFLNAPEEQSPPRPLMPSRPSEEDCQAVMSPLVASQEYRFKRGNLTHKLLQFLPDFSDDVRENAARNFLQKNAQDVSGDVRDSIVLEVLKILRDPDYAPFFKPGSIAEVSVTGLLSGMRVISGQIDRLVIEDGKIWIVDYKTNRPPPSDPKDIPDIYRKQLYAYRDSVQQIYPDHNIYMALLWTDGPNLMIVE